MREEGVWEIILADSSPIFYLSLVKISQMPFSSSEFFMDRVPYKMGLMFSGLLSELFLS